MFIHRKSYGDEKKKAKTWSSCRAQELVLELQEMLEVELAEEAGKRRPGRTSQEGLNQTEEREEEMDVSEENLHRLKDQVTQSTCT